MDVKAVIHALGALLLCIGASLVFPAIVSFYYGEGDLHAFVISFAIILVTGLAMWWLTPRDRELGIREGFGVVTFSWILMAAFGALPFIFATEHLTYTDAFFETMSGFTTTGATILDDVEILTHALLFWRSFTHWLGGMGIIVLSLAILPMLGVGGMQLFKAEAPGPSVDKLKPRIQDTAKILWGVYVLLTVVETLLLKLGGMTVFDALCHTFGTLATGGFSTKNAGIMYYESAYIQYVITIFMILAGTNFALHYRALRGQVGVYQKNAESRSYVGIILFVTAFVAFSTRFSSYESYSTAFMKGAFQVASLMTTTGYHSANYELWPVPVQLILVMVMFIGGCAGSTGGGIKVVRVSLTVKYLFLQLKRFVHPHAVIPVRFNGVPISRNAMQDILGFVLAFFIIFGVGSFMMTLLGLDMVTATSSVVSTLANIGPGIGEIGPTENYAHIPVAGKWLLSFFMLVGRLEIFTVLVMFNRHFWIK